MVEATENKSKPGEYRPITLRDVRTWPEPLYPSVTTVIGDILAKPGISLYRMEQVAIAVHNDRWLEQEDWITYFSRIVKAADEKAERAAEEGTAIHHVIAELLRGREVHPATHGILATPIGRDVKEWMDAQGFECERPEHTFANAQLGFAGTADWIGSFNGRPVLLDIKSQEWTVGDKDRPYFYDEYPIQLAGYAIGLGLSEHERWSLVVNRNRGVCDPVVKNWSKPTEKLPNPNRHYDQIWEHLWNLWRQTKLYWPGGGVHAAGV